MHKETSIWQLCHGGEPFEGLRIPFGALVHFMQTPAKLDKQAKASARLVPGIFLYHYLHPYGKWRGEYVVAPLTAFAELDFSANARHPRLKIQRVREVKLVNSGP